MTLVRWNPYRNLVSFPREVDPGQISLFKSKQLESNTRGVKSSSREYRRQYEFV